MLYKKYFTLLFCCCYQLAFGQIGNYTKVKKICKNTYNFLENANFRSRQHADKGLYVVYSDRDENNSYLDALGLKQGQQQKFLTPYFVVGENTDFLELVKFNPDIIGKPQGFFSFLYGSTYNFTDKKSVEYVGWIQKDKLLHFSKSKVNEANLKPLVYYLGVNDTKTLFNLREYIKKDSVYTFNDPNLKIKAKKLFNINQLVYLYKYNTSKKAALVSNFKEIQASDSLERVMGWVPSSLVKKIGQRKVIKIKEDQDVFFTNYDSTYTIKPRDIHSSLLFMPAKKYKKKKSIVDSISPVSHVPLNLWDHYNNKLINVKGGDILLRELPVIKKQNKTFNLHFVFDCSPDLREKLVLQITSLQNIWLLISEDERYKEYDFTFSASSFGCSKYYHFPKSDSFALWLDYLQKIFLNDTTLASKESNAVGIEKCFLNIIDAQRSRKFENNIVMIMGEDNLEFNTENSEILYDLSKLSSRLIFFQLENSSDTNHQDYILKAKQILDIIGDEYQNYITNYIIENKFVLKKNLYTTLVSEENNIYLYDSPDRSMYSGGIVFPKIDQTLTPVSFDIALDSLLGKTIKYNDLLLNSLEKGNKKLGFLRSKPSQRIKSILKEDFYSLNGLPIPKINRLEIFLETSQLNIKQNKPLESGYLFTKKELSFIIESYKSFIPLMSKRIDPKLDKKEKKKQRKALYKKYKAYYKKLNKLLFYTEIRKNNTISELIEIKTGIDVFNEQLKKIKIKEIKQKSVLTNEEHTVLMNYLRTKIEHLETVIEDPKTYIYLDGSKKKYYYVSEKSLL